MAPTTTSLLIHGDTQQVLADWPALPNGMEWPDDPEIRRKLGPSRRLDASVTDPPYFVSLDAHAAAGRQDWDSAWKTPHEFQTWVKAWAEKLGGGADPGRGILWPGGWLLAFSAGRTSHLMQGGIEESGLGIIDMGIWLYATGQVKQKTTLKPAHEPITFSCKATKKTATAEFKANGRALLHSEEMAKAEGRHPLNVIADGGLAEVESVDGATDLDTLAAWKFFTVGKPNPKERDWGCDALPLRAKEGGLSGNALGGGPAAEARNIHPTVKPVDLMRRLVRLVTKPGAWVIDPFMGSGTTGIACVLEGRNFIGIEREKDFHEISTHRINAAHALVAKLGRTLGPTEAFADVAFD